MASSLALAWSIMFRQGFEKGLASVVARWMLDGSAEALIERVARSGALTPEQLEKLRTETLDNLRKVKDEGAPYADMATAALREVMGHVPMAPLWSAAVQAGSGPWKAAAGPVAQAAVASALQVAARSAEAAAARAAALAERFAPEAAADNAPVSDDKDDGPQP